MERHIKHDGKECQSSLAAIDDALYVIGGKWKLRIISALRDMQSQRFNELQRMITGISAKVLSNELKQLEMNGFVRRKVYGENTAIVEYELTEYSETLSDVLSSLVTWGTMHRRKIQQEDQIQHENHPAAKVA